MRDFATEMFACPFSLLCVCAGCCCWWWWWMDRCQCPSLFFSVDELDKRYRSSQEKVKGKGSECQGKLHSRSAKSGHQRGGQHALSISRVHPQCTCLGQL
ncbi:hypothetical protein BC939DRAFT_459107 [Gamsiella multidivaricata]|uniref:uncharacterized protein n=1 Tax=Gamsiella multidivaricata TaxID=101098 RepID=UPI00221F1300|nr:uncharacterized protein BC939DRAFT_459107 [Gamsiella multidivaricata]KAI7819956.1 hypothetical protein BC939DRAFT_459107 [Gamsiella multidivaricata]